MQLSPEQLAKMIDHTLLKPEATTTQIEQLCSEAREYNFASVCVNSSFVPQVTTLLASSPVRVCAVVGFPLGAMLSQAKAAETRLSIERGASEIDMVMHIGALKSEDISMLHHDISMVVAECQLNDALCKVIIETSLLDNNEKVIACRVAQDAGAHFVKTSTGFSTAGATADDVRLMRQTVGDAIGVKASGGIRSLADARMMIEAGANRLGMSAGVAVMKEMLGQASGTSSHDGY